MPDYKNMYFQLAAKVADAVELLMEAQKQGEESYISDEKRPAVKIADLQKENKKTPPD